MYISLNSKEYVVCTTRLRVQQNGKQIQSYMG